MTNEEFLKDICPNHTDKSKWNKSELLHILDKYQALQLQQVAVSGSEYEEHTDCPKICKCEKPEIAKPHLGDGGYDWCNICNGVVW